MKLTQELRKQQLKEFYEARAKYERYVKDHKSSNSSSSSSSSHESKPPPNPKQFIFRKLLSFVKHRWNSWFISAWSLIRSKTSVKATLSQSKEHSSKDPSGATWELWEDLVKILEPMYILTVVLSANSFPSIAICYRAFYTTITYLDDLAAQFERKHKPLLAGFAAELRSILSEIITTNLSKSWFISAFFHPPSRTFDWLSSEVTRRAALETVKQAIFAHHWPAEEDAYYAEESKERKVASPPTSQVGSDNDAPPNLFSMLGASGSNSIDSAPRLTLHERRVDLEKRINYEVDAYCNSKTWTVWLKFAPADGGHGGAQNINPTSRTSCDKAAKRFYSLTATLNFWKQAIHLPLLRGSAPAYLSPSATSVPSERVFSVAGDVIRPDRASLSPELAELLILARLNPDLLMDIVQKDLKQEKAREDTAQVVSRMFPSQIADAVEEEFAVDDELNFDDLDSDGYHSEQDLPDVNDSKGSKSAQSSKKALSKKCKHSK